MKSQHEFRDPVHGFVSCSSLEREVIDSWPFQRLRNIHQLAMTFLVYPGATHKRFEHSLGVMELASRVFDVITAKDNTEHLPEPVLKAIPQISDKSQLQMWRQTLRMAALCHDIGHLPFSHGAEDLLPDNTTHETMTWRIITSDIMKPLWDNLGIEPEKIARLAVKPAEIPSDVRPSTTWEILLSEIIAGDAFGVDRMDYLLRDSLHLGVSYGHFDLQRVVPTLRVGCLPAFGESAEDLSTEPLVGIHEGGLHAAAALLWARYSIFSQVYFHRVRRVYDLHLQDFIRACYPEGYTIDIEKHCSLTDNEILARLSAAARDGAAAGHEPAAIIANRKHYRCVYRQSNADRERSGKIDTTSVVFDALSRTFPSEQLKIDSASKKHKRVEFPVVKNLGKQTMMLLASQEMPSINLVPDVEAGYIFASPKIFDDVSRYLHKNLDRIFDAEGGTP